MARRARQTLPPPLEVQEHIAVVDALRAGCSSGWLWTHIPSGEERDKRVAAKLQRMGVQPGWPDLLLIDPEGMVHGLELKRVKRGHLNKAQQAFATACQGRAVLYAVARGAEEAIAILRMWGALTRLRVSA